MNTQIRLGDGRRCQLRAVPGFLIVTYGKDAHNELRREAVSDGDPGAARQRINDWAAAQRKPEPIVPPLDAIGWARQLVRDVQRIDEIDAAMSTLAEEKARLRGQIEEARR